MAKNGAKMASSFVFLFFPPRGKDAIFDYCPANKEQMTKSGTKMASSCCFGCLK
jgi:hypothetical protein